MFWAELVIALIVALLITLIFGVIIGIQWPGRTGVRPSLILFFILVFLSTWVGGIWTEPFGPTILGVSWIPFVLVGLIIALIIAAAIPPRKPVSRQEAIRQAEAESETRTVLGFFFWLLLVLLVAALIIYYVT